MAFLKYRGNTVTPNKPIETTATNAPLTNADIDGNFASLDFYKLENHGYTEGDIVYANASGVLTKLGISPAGKYLSSVGGVPAWADAIAIELATARNIAITGDISYNVNFDGSENVTGVATLATVNSDVGSFGSSTAIPIVTVNAKGLVTAVSTANVSSTLPISGDTGTDNVSLLTDTLAFVGGTGLTSSVTNNTVTFDIDSTVATLTGTQTLTNKSLSGSDNTFSNIPNSALGDSGVVADTYNNVTVNSKGVVTAGSNIAYLTVESDTLASVTGRGATTGEIISLTNLTDSSSTTTGALVVSGGVGIAKKLFVGADAKFESSVQIDGNLKVSGTTTTINAENLAVADNMIYLNEGSVNANPDLGISGGYNDGTYAHAGIFRDASDGTWKFFKGYTEEPGVFIDTSHPSFQLADLQVNALSAAVISGAEVIATQDLNANIVYITNNNYEAYHQGNTKTIGGTSIFGVGDIDSLNISVNSASNLSGGSAYSIPIQSGFGTTSYITAGFNGQFLTYGALGPQWSTAAASATTDTTNATNITTGTLANARTTATNANNANTIVLRDASGGFSAGTIVATLSGNSTSATNISGGALGSIPYQNASSTTLFLAAGTSGQVLRSNGVAAPSWLTLAASATTDTTNATNITTGTLAGARGVTSGSTSASFVTYNGTTATAGQFDGGTTTPTGTTRLNYGGYLYTTQLNLVGTADTATAASHYFVETSSDGFVRPKTLANVQSEIVTTAVLGSGTANATTYLRGDRTWATLSVGTTITDDTTTNATRYLTFTSATTGTISAQNVSSTKLTFNPSTGDLGATNFNSLSDFNKKEDIETIVNAIELLMHLRGVFFRWKETGAKGMGVIAQEIENVLPEVVVTLEDGTKTVSYGNIVGLMIEAVKNHEARICKLENTVFNK